MNMKTHELFLLLVLLFYLNAKALSKSVETSTPIFRELPIYSSDFVQDSFDKTSKTELDPDGNSVDGLPKYWQARLGDICQLPSFPRATGDPTKYLECVKQGLSEDRADLGLWTLRECVQGFEFVAAARRCKSIRLINRQQLMCSSSRAADYDFCPSGTGDEFEIHETRQTPRRCSCPNGADDCLCPRPEILEPVKVARRTRTTEIVIDHTPAMRFQSFQTNCGCPGQQQQMNCCQPMTTRTNFDPNSSRQQFTTFTPRPTFQQSITPLNYPSTLANQQFDQNTGQTFNGQNGNSGQFNNGGQNGNGYQNNCNSGTSNDQNGFNNQMPSSNNQNGFTGSSQNFNGQTTQNGFNNQMSSTNNQNGQTTQNGFSNQQQSTNQNNGFTSNQQNGFTGNNQQQSTNQNNGFTGNQQSFNGQTTQNGFNNQTPSSNSQNNGQTSQTQFSNNQNNGFTTSQTQFPNNNQNNGFTTSNGNFNGQTSQTQFPNNQQQSTNQNNFNNPNNQMPSSNNQNNFNNPNCDPNNSGQQQNSGNNFQSDNQNGNQRSMSDIYQQQYGPNRYQQNNNNGQQSSNPNNSNQQNNQQNDRQSGSTNYPSSNRQNSNGRQSTSSGNFNSNDDNYQQNNDRRVNPSNNFDNSDNNDCVPCPDFESDYDQNNGRQNQNSNRNSQQNNNRNPNRNGQQNSNGNNRQNSNQNSNRNGQQNSNRNFDSNDDRQINNSDDCVPCSSTDSDYNQNNGRKNQNSNGNNRQNSNRNGNNGRQNQNSNRNNGRQSTSSNNFNDDCVPCSSTDSNYNQNSNRNNGRQSTSSNNLNDDRQINNSNDDCVPCSNTDSDYKSTRNGNTRQNGRQSTASNNFNDDNYQQNKNCVPCRSNNQQNGRQKGNRQFGPTNYPSSNRQNSQNFPQLSPTLMNMKKLMDIQIEIEQLKIQKNQLVRDEFQSNNGRGGSKNNGAGNVAGSSRNGETSKNRDGAYQQQSGNCQMLTTQQQYCPRRDQQAVIQPQPCALVQGSATNARYQGICSWMLDPLASDPESRCHFLQCQPAANNLFCGRWQRMPCAPATVFDAAAQVCVWDTLGQPGPLPLPTPAPPTSAPKIATMQNSGMQLLNSHCNNGPNANLCRGGVQIGSCNSNFQCPGQSVCQIGEIMTLGLMPCTACCYYKSMMHAE